MVLIPCPACEKQISPMATSCPSCGHPADTPLSDRPAVQTVQQTSKRYKGGQLIGMVMVLAKCCRLLGG
jgi:predicted amidophosphoribosyltransferase